MHINRYDLYFILHIHSIKKSIIFFSYLTKLKLLVVLFVFHLEFRNSPFLESSYDTPMYLQNFHFLTSVYFLKSFIYFKIFYFLK